MIINKLRETNIKCILDITSVIEEYILYEYQMNILSITYFLSFPHVHIWMELMCHN